MVRFSDSRLYAAVAMLICFIGISYGQQIPVGRGKDARWESAGKQAVGTANDLRSKVWFTLQGGSLTEVFYPTADKANVQWLQFIVVDRRRHRVETERDDATHTILPLDNDSLLYKQVNRSKRGTWEIQKTYVADPTGDSLLIDVSFLRSGQDLDLYIYYNPSLANSGFGDTAWNETDTLLSRDGTVFSALEVSRSLGETVNGFYRDSDGIDELRKASRLPAGRDRADDGNVTQIGKISAPGRFTVALGFGNSAESAKKAASASLAKGYPKTLVEYRRSWQNLTATLPRVGPRYQKQFNYAAMVLHAAEDKTFRGGGVASLSNPWITGTAANGPNVGGYHLVWSRDLYHAATAFLAIGDRAAAARALDYLFTKQQKPDGSYPQISWLDGRTLGDSIQMDEVAYPLILAYQLQRFDRETYLRHVRPTANYVAINGPKSQQERWEEKGGYSPATIAAEIAGLVCAAEIARLNGDANSATRWLTIADGWEKNIEKWTATTTGKYGDGNYYLRITQNGRPDAGERIELNNNAGSADERDIVDPSFLELVRLGIRAPDDPLIVKTLKVIDQTLKVNTPNGEAWYRYTRDGYGEMPDGRPWNWDLKYTGKGHLWTLLTGERGQYEIALCAATAAPTAASTRSGVRCLDRARSRLVAMLGFANDGLMIPEQVWDKPDGVFPYGEGAGSATPLSWSMAEFIRLAMNLKAGRNIDTPDIVAERYTRRKR